MRIGLAWLGDWVELGDLSPAQVAETLTMVGLEVEDLFDRLAHLEQVLVARVETVAPHGRHLSVCQVTAQETVTVLTGAPNVRVGALYPLAPVGANLPLGLVKATTMAGLVSEGVLCSAQELGLPGGAAGLLELPATTQVGATLKNLYPQADWALDISITPNRADALSARGVARDLAAALNRPLKTPAISLRESGPPASQLAQVNIECPDFCWRYCGRIVTNLVIGPSPDWLAFRLAAAGIRAINNAVDVTNYVMLELGLPLHAFDLANLAGSQINVRLGKAGLSFTTLDGQTRLLKAPENILICDAQKPVALGGIMGGENSAVEATAKSVFLEGACFDPRAIRRTARAQGMATDASYRFERGQDPALPPLAVDRAAELLASISGGVVAPGRLDAYPKVREPIKVFFSPKRCASVLGVTRSTPEIERVLGAIGVGLTKVDPDSDGQLFEASLPTFRPDLLREVDLIEEVARLVDFQGLPATLPKPPAAAQKAPFQFRLKQTLRRELNALGLTEHLGYSFINPNFQEKLSLPLAHPWRVKLVKILNPLSEDHGVLRPCLTPGLLAALRLNQSHGRWSVALFEVGATFHSLGQDRQPLEQPSLGLLWAGKFGEGTWNDPERSVDFWDLKGVVEALGEMGGLDLSFEPLSSDAIDQEYPFYELGQAARILAGGRFLGHLGSLSPHTRKAFGLKEAGGTVLVAELALSSWPESTTKAFVGWSSYPGVYRDLALLAPDTVSAQAILDEAQADQAIPLTKVTIFDLYQGGNLPQGHKSLALRLFFQSQERTLTDELVNGYFNCLVARLADKLKVAPRA
ncbi:MAG: phenylalanine--tRNA ligase subunit beta [Deltaproteobacteria bacterium]|jgi:phenylalanyl-tRNA synthetase beta chain|nr:phenylalanine--tRNA ligase subunit beta [Deltaproteobacteria bacterium]